MKFSVIGPSGYIAKRHLDAIFNLKGEIVSYLDVIESNFVGKSSRTLYFNNSNDFFQNLKEHPVDYVAICSPNNMHFEHIKQSVLSGSKVICEKPLVIKKEELEELKKLDSKSSKLVFGIMQLRGHPVMSELKRLSQNNEKIAEIKFISRRDKDYKNSWKVKKEHSGGILFNLGVHYFDLLIQSFGKPNKVTIDNHTDFRAEGKITFGDLNVSWLFSIDDNDLIEGVDTIRKFSIGKNNVDFSKVEEDLHAANYREIIDNGNYSFESLEEVHELVLNLNE